jgi:hypothetical protein
MQITITHIKNQVYVVLSPGSIVHHERPLFITFLKSLTSKNLKKMYLKLCTTNHYIVTN